MKARINAHDVRRLLVIRPDHIGDLMLITPVLRAMKVLNPAMHITALIRAYTDPIARLIPDIDELMHETWSTSSQTLSDLWSLTGELRARNFDMVIHFTTNYPYTVACTLAGIPYRVGDGARIGMRLWLNVDVRQYYRNTTLHEVDHNYDLCNVFDRPLSLQPLSIRLRSDALPAFKQRHALGPEPRVVMHLGTGGGNKPWLPERFAALADEIFEQRGLPTLIIGSESEIPLAERFAKAARHDHRSLVGLTALGELPLAIACGSFFVGVDSGPMHLAAALQIPTLAIFPPRW